MHHDESISNFEYAAAKAKRIGSFAGHCASAGRVANGVIQPGQDLGEHRGVLRAYRGIAESNGDPGLGLKLGTEERVERYDPIKIAALSARSFRDAVERLSRYKQLTCPEEIRIVKRGNESAVQFIWLLAHEEEPPLLVDVCFAWIVGIGQRGIGRPMNLNRVELQRAPARREMYEAHFRCPVTFKSKQNALVFSNADMELSFVTTYNPDLLAIIAPHLEAELAQQLADKTFTEQAKGILKQLLAGQRPGIQDLARELHVSTRTLQWRLTEQGITFQRLLEEASGVGSPLSAPLIFATE